MDLRPIREVRVGLDGLMQLNKFMFEREPARTLSMLFSSLERSKFWFGRLLVACGGVQPYTYGYQNVSDIQPATDMLQVDPVGNFGLHHGARRY